MPTKKLARTRFTVYFDNGGHQDYILDPKVDEIIKQKEWITVKRANPSTVIEIDRSKVTHTITTKMQIDAEEVELRKRVLQGEGDDDGPELL